MDNISQMKRREYLKGLIDEWNANRLDLFEISHPDEVSKKKARNDEYHWQVFTHIDFGLPS